MGGGKGFTTETKEMADGEKDREPGAGGGEGGGMGGARLVLMAIGGGLALSAVALGILLLISSSHIDLPAKCSPLADPFMEENIRDLDPPCFAEDSDVRTNISELCDSAQPNLYRSSVRVEGGSLCVGLRSCQSLRCKSILRACC